MYNKNKGSYSRYACILFAILFLFACLPKIFAQNNGNNLIESFREYQKAKQHSVFHIKTIELGPMINSARVESVQGVASKPGTIYAAFGSGNLWKTISNGQQWKPIFENQASHGIGDVAIAPSNPDVLYVGTGESLRKNRNFTIPGSGLYRSDDGGESWKHLGLENIWHTGEITVHPKNPEIVIVAAMGSFWSDNQHKGIYRTIDGGITWEKVLFVNERVRAVDVVMAPSDPNVIYAALWENQIENPLPESVYGEESSVYKSSDGGDHWTKIDMGFASGPKTGRIGLAVSYSNPNKVYAVVDNLNKKRSISTEIYRTVNGGKAWSRTHERDLKFLGTIGWYFSDIYVNPKNDEEVYALGIRLARSSNGGKDFEFIEGIIKHVNPSPAQTLHLDQCELWINPENPANLILGNDGGIYTSFDKGKNWMHFNNIPTGEFYTISIEKKSPYKIYGGTQDNATVFGPGIELNPDREDSWEYLWIDAWSGGDGCITQIDPADENIIYFSSQNGGIMKRDIKTGRSKGITTKLRKEFKNLTFNFIAPYFLSPHHSQTLYLGGNYIFKTTDQGGNWIKISHDFTISSKSDSLSAGLGSIAESKLKKGLLFAGTDVGDFWWSQDDGKNWETSEMEMPKAYIRSIHPSKYNESSVFWTMTGLNYDDLNSYVYHSKDYGKTPHSITGNLPKEPANVILQDPLYENILYIGTFRGVYISLDKGGSWNLLSTDMAAVSIGDLKINEQEKDLIIGTHGRGMYKIELEPIYQMMTFLKAENSALYLCEIDDIQAPKRRDTHRDIDLESLEKLDIFYYSIEDQKIDVKIENDANEILTEWTENAKKGLNQIRWNLVIKENKSDEPYFTKYREYLKTGIFKAVISTVEYKTERTFLVKNRR